MAANNERRFSLADFIKSERVKRNENEVEDFKTKKSSDDKRSVTSIQPSNDGSIEKEEISALYPVRVKRNQTRHRRNSEFYGASRKSITQDMVNKELCGVVTDEDDKDISTSTLSRGYYKRRRRFSVIQDNEGSSFTMEDKIRALQEEGGTHHKRNGRSGKSRRTNRSTISPFPSSAHSRSTSGSLMFGDRHESASVYSETQRETTPKKNRSENENSKMVNEEEHNNENTIKVEIRRGSSRTKNIVVSLQVEDTTQKMEEKDVNNCNVETYQSRISIESKHSQREGMSKSGMTNSTDKMSSQIIIAQDEKNIEIKNHEQDEPNAGELSNKLQDSCISEDKSNKQTFSEDSATLHKQEKNENMKSPDNISVTTAKEDNIQNVDPPNLLNVTIDPGKPPDAPTVELQSKPSESNFDKSKTEENIEPQKTDNIKDFVKTNKSEAEDNIDNGTSENTNPRESNKPHYNDEMQNVDDSASNIKVTSSECREENKVSNVEPITKSKAEVDLSNQYDSNETNNYIGNCNKTKGISNKGFQNSENVENKSKDYESMSENVEVSTSDTPKTDMNDITNVEEMAPRVDQPIPQTTVDPLTSSNEEQEAIKFSQSKVIESGDTTSNEADKHGVFLCNGSKTTVSHTNSSESPCDDDMEEETNGLKSKSNQSRVQHEALEAKTNTSENKTTSSKHVDQISVDLSETDKRSHATEKPRVATLTIDDSKTEKRTDGNNPKSLSQMSLPNNFHSFAKSLKSLLQEEIEYSELFVKSLQDVRAHNANLYKSVARRLHREEESSDTDQSPGTSLEQTSPRRTTAISASTRTGRDDDKQETVKQRKIAKTTQDEADRLRENRQEKTNLVFNQDAVQNKTPKNDPLKECKKDTVDEKVPLNDCNKDTDKETNSLNDCDQDTNKESGSLSDCNKDMNKENDSFDDCKRYTDEEKDSLNDCNQDTNKENESLDDCNRNSDKEKEQLNDSNKGTYSLNNCDKDADNEKDSLNDCNKDMNKEFDSYDDCKNVMDKEKDSLNDCNRDTNREKVSFNDCNMDTDKERDSLNYCNRDIDKEKDSLNDCNRDCNKDTNKEKDSLNVCNRDTDKEKDSLNNCNREKDKEKDSFNDCNKDTDMEKDSLSDCNRDTDKEKDSLNDCNRDTNKEKDSLNDCNRDTNKEKDSLMINDCNRDTDKAKDSLNDCNRDTNREKVSFNDCNMDTDKERDSLNYCNRDCNRDTNREKDSLNDCNRDTDKEKDSLNDCNRDTDKEKDSLNDCNRGTDKEKDLLSDCNRDTDKEKDSLIDCNQDTDKENESLDDCNRNSDKEKEQLSDSNKDTYSLNNCDKDADNEKGSLNECNKDKDKEKDLLSDYSQDTNRQYDSLNYCNQDEDKEKDSLYGCNQDADKEKEQLNGSNRDIDKEKYKLKQNASKEKVQLSECDQDMNKEKFLLNESSRDRKAKVQIDDSIQDTSNGTVFTDDNQAEIITPGSEATQIGCRVGIGEYDEPSFITKTKARYDATYDNCRHDSGNKNDQDENILSNYSQDRQYIEDKNQNDIQKDETEEWMQSNKIQLKRFPIAQRFIENYVEQDKGFFNEAVNPNHVSKSQTPSLPKIEIVIKNDDTHRENDLTLVIKLPQDGKSTRETSYVKSMKDQFCQTDEDSQRASTRPQEALPQISCEPPLLQSKERSFIRLHHKSSREPEPDPEVLYFIKQAELRQRRRIDDIMREIYQIKHVDLLEPPMCSCPDYVYPGSRDHHPRFMYDSDPYDSMVVNAAQYNDSVRRFLGYTKRSDRLKAMEHSRKYKAYLDLRKKLKHLY